MHREKLRFLIEEAARQFPQRPALIDGTGEISYKRYMEIIRRIVQHLEQYAIAEETPVALLSHEELRYPVLLMSLIYLKALAFPIDPRLAPRTIKTYLEKFHIPFLIYDQKPVLDLEHINTISFDDLFKNDPPSSQTGDFSGYSLINPNQAATVILTSGSSGKAKAAVHSYGNHYYSALGSNDNLPLSAEDKWLLSLPLFHVSGISLLFRTAIAGAALVIPEATRTLNENIKKFRPTHISLVNSQLSQLLQDESMNDGMSSMKAILLGGSAIQPALIRQAFERHWPLFVSYGSTEMSSQITTTGKNAGLKELFTSGHLLKYRELTFAKDGEILVRGKTLFSGYWDNGNIKQGLTADDWFASGDLGYLDGMGRLVVKGRKNRMFISGGENIYPEEIERALLKLNDVKQAVVVPIAHPAFGHRPVAIVDTPREKDQLKNELRKILPKFKLPDHILPWPPKLGKGLKVNPEDFREYAIKTLKKTEESKL